MARVDDKTLWQRTPFFVKYLAYLIGLLLLTPWLFAWFARYLAYVYTAVQP